jgi:hypothetical protein
VKEHRDDGTLSGREVEEGGALFRIRVGLERILELIAITGNNGGA